ncbi:hypothetical protein CGJ39_24545 [Vibrio parahaemolyticus]|nr:hypothetical protein CGJ39_24545 [Vibrio parahaemolyticus]
MEVLFLGLGLVWFAGWGFQMILSIQGLWYIPYLKVVGVIVGYLSAGFKIWVDLQELKLKSSRHKMFVQHRAKLRSLAEFT